MGRQGELILEIDQILGNFSDVSYLRSKLAGLQSKAEALDLYIEEKQNCISERERAKKKGSNEEIRETMERLRQKKKEFGSQVNKYCEGVAKKLESQIKKLLKVYNLTYSCAEGLDQLLAERARHLEDLQATRQRLRLIEEQGFEQYHRSYNSTRDSIRLRLEQMRQFAVGTSRPTQTTTRTTPPSSTSSSRRPSRPGPAPSSSSQPSRRPRARRTSPS